MASKLSCAASSDAKIEGVNREVASQREHTAAVVLAQRSYISHGLLCIIQQVHLRLSRGRVFSVMIPVKYAFDISFLCVCRHSKSNGDDAVGIEQIRMTHDCKCEFVELEEFDALFNYLEAFLFFCLLTKMFSMEHMGHNVLPFLTNAEGKCWMEHVVIGESVC